MTILPFVGRTQELNRLRQLLYRKTANLIVIKGRRRIGKSRLVLEFAKGIAIYEFSGLAPTEKITAHQQREEFARQISERFGIGRLRADDWGDLFTTVARLIKDEPAILFLDEIAWMGSKDSTFLSKLKIAWDKEFSRIPKLNVVLCASVSAWIEKNIMSSTGYFGRVCQKVSLDELCLSDCNNLLKETGFRGSPHEKFMIYSLTGGVPWYIEMINPALSAVENIRNLCFVKDGTLVDEYQHIFHDLFGRRNQVYRQIVEQLVTGALSQTEILNNIDYPSGGPFSEYMEELVESGFLSRDYSWKLGTAKKMDTSQYRLRDNYLRFYLKYIEPNRNQISRNRFADISISNLPAFDTIMGLQFENLVLNNRKLLLDALGIKPEDILNDNRYFQTETTKHRGCQIDYLIQTKYKTLYLVEVKFSRQPINSKIIRDIQEKINCLAIPRGYACLPILVYISELNESVEKSDFFYRTINFCDFLN